MCVKLLSIKVLYFRMKKCHQAIITPSYYLLGEVHMVLPVGLRDLFRVVLYKPSNEMLGDTFS